MTHHDWRQAEMTKCKMKRESENSAREKQVDDLPHQTVRGQGQITLIVELQLIHKFQCKCTTNYSDLPLLRTSFVRQICHITLHHDIGAHSYSIDACPQFKSEYLDDV